MVATVTSVTIDGLSDDQRQALMTLKVGDLVLFEKRDEEEDANSASAQEEDGSDSEDEENDEDEEESADSMQEGSSDGEREKEEAEVDEGVVLTPGRVTDDGSHGQLDEDGDEPNENADSAHGNVVGDASSNEEDDAEDHAINLDQGDEGGINARCLYLTTNVVVDKCGALTDAGFIKLPYNANCDDTHSYQVYGTEVMQTTSNNCAHAKGSAECERYESMHELCADGGLENFTLTLNPGGDHLRTEVFPELICPIDCRAGWLDSLEELAEYVHKNNYVSPATMPHQPICPVCCGLDLLREQQNLRLLLEAHLVDLGQVVEFTGRLNVRRSQIGLEFRQFDERDWGMLFDDMIIEIDDGSGDGDDGQGGRWEQWDEALDPNAEVNIKYRPASDAEIAALPRVAYQDLPAPFEGEEKATICQVCRDEYGADTIVVVLPCMHFSCDGPCTEEWLKHYSSCPVCRGKVTPEGSKEERKTVDSQARSTFAALVLTEQNSELSVGGGSGEDDATTIGSAEAGSAEGGGAEAQSAEAGGAEAQSAEAGSGEAGSAEARNAERVHSRRGSVEYIEMADAAQMELVTAAIMDEGW
ncbi:hypothetical protein LTR08_006702 [Meristemomyces frigidus]|nr:hypothetical protein LTR08_006702 [Meristemomyces frigidus]